MHTFLRERERYSPFTPSLNTTQYLTENLPQHKINSCETEDIGSCRNFNNNHSLAIALHFALTAHWDKGKTNSLIPITITNNYGTVQMVCYRKMGLLSCRKLYRIALLIIFLDDIIM